MKNMLSMFKIRSLRKGLAESVSQLILTEDGHTMSIFLFLEISLFFNSKRYNRHNEKTKINF